MTGRDIRASSDTIGVAGRCTTEEEKAYVKQAVFLLRYRIRFLHGEMHGEFPATSPK